MAKSRWRIAEHTQQCRNCRDFIGPGELHVSRMCLRCTLPAPLTNAPVRWNAGAPWEPPHDPHNWMTLYYAELTRAVRADWGYD